MKYSRRYKDTKAFTSNWFSAGATVMVMTLSSIYVLDLNQSWCNKDIATVLHVYFADSVTFDVHSLPLKIKAGDTVFFVDDFQKTNIYHLRVKPQQIGFVLMTNNGQILSSDTLYFNGAKHVCFIVHNGSGNAKIPSVVLDVFEFYPL